MQYVCWQLAISNTRQEVRTFSKQGMYYLIVAEHVSLKIFAFQFEQRLSLTLCMLVIALNP